MKESTAGRLSGIFLILSLLFLAWMVEGCATKRPVEITEYCATYYTYYDKFDLWKARGQKTNGFHRTKTDGSYEVHYMYGEHRTLGHEVSCHGLTKEGKFTMNPHCKNWSKE